MISSVPPTGSIFFFFIIKYALRAIFRYLSNHLGAWFFHFGSLPVSYPWFRLLLVYCHSYVPHWSENRGIGENRSEGIEVNWDTWWGRYIRNRFPPPWAPPCDSPFHFAPLTKAGGGWFQLLVLLYWYSEPIYGLSCHLKLLSLEAHFFKDLVV